MRNRQHRRALVLAVTATLTGSGALALPAAADAPTPSVATAALSKAAGSRAALLPAPQRQFTASQRELFRVQEQIDAAAGRVRQAVSAHGLAGFNGVVVSAPTKELTLYWHGPLPASMTALIAKLSTPDVHVVVRPATYSLAALRRAADVMRTDPKARAARVSTISVNSDGSGITIRVPDAPGSTGTGGSRPALPAVPVRVTVERAGKAVPLSGRWADVNPFWGGSMTLTDGVTPTQPCTAGWPMHFPAEGDRGYHLMLTAAHCGFGTYRTPAGQTVGVSVEDKGDVEHDTRTIDTNLLGDTTRTTGYAIYTGAVDETGAGQNETAALIAGPGQVEEGDRVYLSGGFSGESVLLTVTQPSVDHPNGAATVRMIEVENPTFGQAAAGAGDSGGPVYRYNSVGDAEALGTISAGDSNTVINNCPGVATYRGVNRTCYRRIWVSNVNFALAFYGAQLNTA